MIIVSWGLISDKNKIGKVQGKQYLEVIVLSSGVVT